MRGGVTAVSGDGFGEDDAECGADADFGLFDEYAAVVVFFDDAFGEGEAEPPSALFGGEAGLEDGLELFTFDAFAGVGDVYVDVAAGGCYFGGDGAVALHGVDGVFAEVFYDPFEEWGAEHGVGFGAGAGEAVADATGCAALHVADGVLYGVGDVGGCE